ncbi:dynein heavy chain at 16F isoform X2 [Rhodnius prolixus]|uniref:dynein heavy chain at 16F isoform X2 n=1 Tax=Rhodnius prolixus TaxID=13249 RepID=UPI003D18C0A8
MAGNKNMLFESDNYETHRSLEELIKGEEGLPTYLPHRFVLEKFKRSPHYVMSDPFPGVAKINLKKFENFDDVKDLSKGAVPCTEHKLPVRVKKVEIQEEAQLELQDCLDPFELIDIISQKGNYGQQIFLTYANPISTRFFSFYRFKIIQIEKVNKSNYKALTLKGLLEVSKTDVHFTPMEQFKQEYELFRKLNQFSFIGQYHLYKSITTWFRMIKWRKLQQMIITLDRKYLFRHASIRNAILNISNACWHCSHFSFFNEDVGEKLTINKFLAKQLLQVETMLSVLTDMRKLNLQIMLNASIAYLLEKGFTVHDTNLKITDEMRGFAGVASLGKSEDGTYFMPVESQVEKLLHCETLIRVVKLSDFMVQTLLHSVLHKSYTRFLKKLEQHYKHLPKFNKLKGTNVAEVMEEGRTSPPLNPLLVVSVVVNQCFNADLAPHRRKWERVLNVLLDKWESVCFQIHPLLVDPQMDVITKPFVCGNQVARLCGPGPDLKQVLSMDPTLRNKRMHIFYKFRNNLRTIYRYLSRLKFLTESHKINLITDPNKIKEEMDSQNIRELMKRYHEQTTVLKNLPPGMSFGIFYLDEAKIKCEVNPLSEKLTAIMHVCLPQLCELRITLLVLEVEKSQAFLKAEPCTSSRFVEYVTFVDKMVSRIEELKQWYSYLHRLISIAEEFDCPLQKNTIIKYLDLGGDILALHETILNSVEKREEMIEKFISQVENDYFIITCQIEEIAIEINEPWLIDKRSDIEKAQAYIDNVDRKLQVQIEEVNLLKNYQKRCQVEINPFELLDKVTMDVSLRSSLWNTKTDLRESVKYWKSLNFNSINVDEMQQVLAKYFKNISQFEKYLPPSNLVKALKKEAEDMRNKIPVIAALRNPNLKERHWESIGNLLNVKIAEEQAITLLFFEKRNIYVPEIATKLMGISAQATSESVLETLLIKVEDVWRTYEFTVVPHKDSADVSILGGIDELQVVIDESNINLGTISSSRYIGPIKARVKEWVDNMDLFAKTMEEWVSCQQNWLYLQPIFTAPDIKRQLPIESRLFSIVDKSWKDVMRSVNKTPLAFPFATSPGLYETFKNNNKLIEQIMKCLESYLESKRVAFPRFYFLSNDELLEILAQTRNPHAVQPHLTKCFDAISRLKFIKQEKLVQGENKEMLTTEIEAIISPEGETIDFRKTEKARGNVEEWLGRVEAAMFQSVHDLLAIGLSDLSEMTKSAWVLSHASQVVLVGSQIFWAVCVHYIFNNPEFSLKMYESKCFEELNTLAELVRGKLSRIQRKVLCALITLSVHSRDIVSDLVKKRVTKDTSFEWAKQLRYYWDPDLEDCIVHMASAKHTYGYEYLGASDRLVVTPLTDKCYLCLMGALQLDLGGAPAGPAGTGKTETTKDLAKALAIQCVVFNCSEGLDYKMMGRFFSGLAQSGAWCCFDEFNRIDIEVLSVIAQQLITIRNAKAAKASRFFFEGRDISLNPQCATFITMNPGYAGRTELPDNLKSVFRPMAMMVPDYGLIAEVILYSEGFVESKSLSQKMVNLYKLCSEQLSQQDHYDFGMRAVKSVLVMAGSLKRSNPNIVEDIVLIRALRDSNLPKFLADDVSLFQSIIGDLFPNVVIPEHDYGLFQSAIESVVASMALQPEKSTYVKTIQLFETMEVRHGIMNVGPTGSGKTTVLNVLQGTLKKLFDDKVPNAYYRPVKIYTLNPKSVTMGELYGEVNLMTMEWRDGLLGMFVRTAVNVGAEIHQWIACDGPVDAVWIENMNTVLDDNKMLCLANSERIKLTPWVHMVFEVQDLAQASPATVSRCGMVYYDPEELKWFPYAKSWAQNLLSENRITLDVYNLIIDLFQKYIEPGLVLIKKSLKVGIHQVEIGKAAMLCSILKNLLSDKEMNNPSLDWSVQASMIYQAFIFAYVWSIGGNLLDQHRSIFEEFVHEQFEGCHEARLHGNIQLWDCFFDPLAKKLVPWHLILPSFVYDSAIPFFNLQVPTIDTVRFGYLMTMLLEENHPVMFTGVTGVGKSVVAKSVLNDLLQTEKWGVVNITFSAQTSSMRTQAMIEAKLEKKRKTILGAPVGKRLAVFIDDVNMPKLEIYGAQPPIELLRQYLDFKGFFDRKTLIWKQIESVVLSVACAPPGGGRNPLTPRFVRHFALLEIPSPTDATLKVIFTAIMRGFLADFVQQVRVYGESMVLAAIELYGSITRDLLPTPAKSHYVFNLRDLSKCIQGVLQANSATTTDSRKMLRLFYHECMRVFHDRLVDVDDKSYFLRKLSAICNEHFGSYIMELPEEGPITNPPVLLFGDFMTNAPKEEKIYEEITDLSKLKNVLQDALLDYNLVRGKDMKLIFFMDAVEHVCRIARILRAERGNALLVGVGGMGKQSLTRLGSHINECNCFQIELTKNYDYNSFHDDLRLVFYKAGVKNEDMVFLFTDTQIVQEEFLEDINNILNSGEVPNLFEGDDREKVLNESRGEAKAKGKDANRDTIFEFFISNVRSRLHLSLCMSPIGEAFRRRCRMFPSIVNCCTIDWFLNWPQEALVSVAQSTLAEQVDAKYVENMANICYIIHKGVEDMTVRFFNEMRRHYYVTPSSYLDLLKLYETLHNKNKNSVSATLEKISNGVKKILETNDLVAVMQAQIREMEPLLKAKSASTDKLMESLVKEKAAADEVRLVVVADESAAKEKANECQALADDAQKDLNLAMPAMEAAIKALDALNKNDINEVRVFIKPPNLVKFVMEAVCLLLGAKQDWTSAKIVLGEGNFLKRLRDYDKDHIPEMLQRKLKAYIEHPDFDPEKVALQSRACKSLCMWVRAIDKYAKIYKVVEPKRKRVEASEKILNQMMSVLRAKQKTLADVEAQIAALEASYDKSLREKAELEAAMNLCESRLERAGRLKSALGSELIRWEMSIKELSVAIINLIGDVLVAAACVAYLGPFTNIYREELSTYWSQLVKEKNVPSSPEFSLIDILSDPYEIRTWITNGLPRDKVSIENAIYVTKTTRWALMIDPQEQANRWIRQMEAKNDLKMVKLTDATYMRTIEAAVRSGQPVLIWEVKETLDPALSTILLKQIVMQGGRMVIRIGDAYVEYDPNFRLYITTKLSNPHYLPEICIQITLVNFTVTPSGLEDQLLADVVTLERPDLEEQRSELIVQINSDKTQLKAIEDKILKLLFGSKGNILDDEELVQTLNESKITSEIIARRLTEAEATEAKIMVAREGYRSIAARGSCIYFVVAVLADIDPMYQFSLKYFSLIFNHVIETLPKVSDLDERSKGLIDGITLAIYNNVSRSLFEKHKLVFSFLLCTSILRHAKEILEAEWNFLINGPVGVSEVLPSKPDVAQLTDLQWTSVNYLSNLNKKFRSLATDLDHEIEVELGDYHLDINLTGGKAPKHPVNFNTLLNSFEKLLLVKALKEEKLFFIVTQFVKLLLGEEFVKSPIVSLPVLIVTWHHPGC